MLKIFTLVLILFTSFSVSAKDYELIVTLTTGKEKHAKTDKLKIYVQVNDDKKHRFYLNKPNYNDFETGATDTYDKMKFDASLNQIRHIIIGAESGDDAWLLRNATIQIKDGERLSRPIPFKTKTWFSCEKSDRRSVEEKKFRVRGKIQFQN